MKKLLYFFPLNPADNNTGSCRRALGLLQYFKQRGFSVDFMSQEDWGQWTPESKAKFQQLGLNDRLFILQRKPPKKNPVGYFFRYKLWHWFYNMKLGKIDTSIPNHTTLNLRRHFDEIIHDTHYDGIIISYAYWAHLLYDNDRTEKKPTIIDTHDFLTAQHVNDDELQPGIAFGDEIKRLDFFKRVWAISPEEQYLYTQMLGPKVDYIPAWVPEPTDEHIAKTIDVLYVATDNPHNLKSAQWFFEAVKPLLPTNINLTVIGTIVPHLVQYLQGINTIDYVEDINHYYQMSKVAICPMLTGTGLKIKVIEAMANGLPVVCNERGLDGLPMRLHNGCMSTNDPKQFAEHIKHLLSDNAFYVQQSAMAKSCYNECFSKQTVYDKLDAAMQTAGLA